VSHVEDGVCAEQGVFVEKVRVSNKVFRGLNGSESVN